MNRTHPQLRHFAKRLIVFDARCEKSSPATGSAVFGVPEKLHRQLTALMGEAGFRSLLGRAVILASADLPSLRGVHVKADGSLDGTAEFHAAFGPDEVLEGGVVVLARLLGLLVEFIGENITLRLVHETWPVLPLLGLDLENRGKNEKTK